MKTAPEILEAGISHMQARAATYDKPEGERSMGRTVEAFNAITGKELTEEQGWLLMGLLKMVRSQQGGFKLDNYEDEAVYAALRGECAARDRAAVYQGAAVDLTRQPVGTMTKEPQRPRHVCPTCAGGHSLAQCNPEPKIGEKP